MTNVKAKQMATLSEHHKTTTTLGNGRCSVPMWMNGLPAGFCDEPAYGPQTKQYLDGFKYRDPRYNRPAFASALACHCHGGPTLAESIAGRIAIRFDGPPSPDFPRFIEVERDGKSISHGDWVQDGQQWLLVLPLATKETP